MAEQTSRLAIILDSTGAKRNADTLATSLERLTTEGDKASSSTDELGFSFKRLAASTAGALSIASVIKLVDDWGQIAAQVKNTLRSVEGDIENYANIQQRFLEISNRNGKDIGITQQLYIGAAKSMQELGYSTQQTIDYAESLSSAFTANATSTMSVDSANNALIKSMITGKVAGENWNAIMRAAPTLLGDIAKELERTNGGIKVTENEVKKLGSNSKISFKLMADSIQHAKDANNALADSMDNTVSDGFTRVLNSAKAYYGEINQGIGITRSMSAGLATISDNFGTVSTVLTGIIGIGAARFFGGLSTSIFLATQQAISNTTATYANATAQGRLAAAAIAARGAFSLIGGPAGAAMLAAGAIFYFYQKAEQAKEEAMALADKVDQLRNSFNKLNTSQLKGVIADSADSLEVLNSELDESNRLITGREIEYKKIETSLIHFGDREQDLAKKRREIDQQRRVSADLEAKIASVTRLSADAVKELNERLSEGKSIFEASTAKGNSLAQTVGLMAAKFREAAEAKANLDNQLSNKEADSSDAAAYLKQLEQQNELLNIKDLRLRAIKKARMDAEKNGASPSQITNIEAAAGAYYDLSKAESDRLKLLNKTSTYSESASQKMLSSLKEQQMVLIQQSTTSEKLGSQAQALVKWQQEIKDIEEKKAKGKLTAEQQSLLASKALITAELERNVQLEQGIKNREAEVKIAAYNKQLMEETAQAQKQYNQTIEMAGMGTLAQGRMQERFRVEEEYMKKKDDLQKQYQDKSSGITEEMYNKETQFISSQLQERLAMLEDFHSKQDAMRGNWTLGVHMALQNYADNARDYSQQAEGFITNSLQNITSGSTDALTDIVTNSKNAFDAIGDFFGDLSKSIIKDLIRIAIQAQITNAITGLFGGIAGGGANAAASGSGTGAMGMSTNFRAYSSGGYTGSGNKYDPRGIVHAGEFVFTKEATDNIGKENLYNLMNTGTLPMDALKNDQYAMKYLHPANQTSNTTNNSSVNNNSETNENSQSTITIHQTITQTISVSGNGDKALVKALQQAASVGAKRGADEAVARIQRDFATNGNTRKLLEK